MLLFGYLADVYRESLTDPIDKNPNLTKTVIRIVEEIHTYFREQAPAIQDACAQSIIALFDCCVPNKQEKLTISLVFYEPLSAVISGGSDRIA